MQYLKLPPNPCYCCRVQLMLCIIHFRFFSGMVQYMLVFSTSVEVASKRHLVKSFYSSKCFHNPSGIISTRIVCLAPAGCTVSVCIHFHWQNSCFRKSRIRSFVDFTSMYALGPNSFITSLQNPQCLHINPKPPPFSDSAFWFRPPNQP